MLDRKI